MTKTKEDFEYELNLKKRNLELRRAIAMAEFNKEEKLLADFSQLVSILLKGDK